MAPAQVTLNGSDFNSVDTLLAAYTGSTVDYLTLVATECIWRWFYTESPTSCVTFNITQGEVYSLQVYSVGGRTGSFVITVALSPPNDAFSAAVTTFPATGITLGASYEAGEPISRLLYISAGSVWYRFTAPAASIFATVRCFLMVFCVSLRIILCSLCMHLYVCLLVVTTCAVWLEFSPQVSLEGSDFYTVMTVFTGTSVDALTQVASRSTCGNKEGRWSCVVLRVVPGTTYSIQVDGLSQGFVAIDVTFEFTPSNDAFSGAVTTFPATDSTLGTTLESGEPLAGTGASGSLWFRFTAPVASTSATVRRDGIA